MAKETRIKMGCSKGEWKAEKVGGEGKCIIHTGDFTLPFVDTFPNHFRQPPVSSEEAEANAQLIVTAVNACKAINPENPLAVAEGLGELYEALKYVIRELDKADIVKADSILMEYPNRAIAKVEGE